jgi:hypothetical protein
MRRVSKEGREPLKERRRKTVTQKRRNSAKAAGHRRSPSTAEQETKVARLTRELNQALEQQAAIRDILRVISNSPSDVQPVLDSVAQHAARICEARVVDILIVDKEVLRGVAPFSCTLRRNRSQGRGLRKAQGVSSPMRDRETAVMAAVGIESHRASLFGW